MKPEWNADHPNFPVQPSCGDNTECARIMLNFLQALPVYAEIGPYNANGKERYEAVLDLEIETQHPVSPSGIQRKRSRQHRLLEFTDEIVGLVWRSLCTPIPLFYYCSASSSSFISNSSDGRASGHHPVMSSAHQLQRIDFWSNSIDNSCWISFFVFSQCERHGSRDRCISCSGYIVSGRYPQYALSDHLR